MKLPRCQPNSKRLTVVLACLIATCCSISRGDEKSDRVQRAKDLQKEGKVYSKGCSEFVSKVLKIDQMNANTIMGDNPTSVGKDNKYTGLTPGDVVGWKSATGSGHVAIYIGEDKLVCIDVEDEGKKPREVKMGYGARELFKSSKY